ncbi:MAG TPA: glycerol-3-phosphate dehydrogenase/oxidase [Gemmatimonadaceae bacterium]|nr:glycerol-3-phosphate dehydrogenase/oxidase [Gemmatimonadaceae bacterium]
MTELFNRPFDLLVIGGGITGCGVARDAAMRGLSVALIERDDFASGTSGRSSRLVHGGIRYLEQGRLHLVYESIRERQTLLRIAPHLVKPLAFTWPVYRGARVGRLKLGAGLLLYQIMALGRSHRPSFLNGRHTLDREPSLRSTDLEGGAVYYDASTDDSRLTVATAVSAKNAGAVVANHVRVTRILRDSGRVVGAEVKSTLDGEAGEVTAQVVVNATGVWQNAADAMEHGTRQRGSKGVHIAVPRERVGNRDAITMISSVDSRVMFCLPAGTHTIIGTTDTWTDESPEDVHASAADVDYLLRSANSYFPDARLTTDDVVSAWAGIRPLVATRSTNPTAASREHSIVVDQSGVISVTGGKLTTYRSMAEEVVDRVQNVLYRRIGGAPTDTVMLPGASREQELARIGEENSGLAQPLVSGLPYTGAHLVYGVKHEMAKTLSDLLIRRIHLAFETRDHGKSVAQRAADIVAPLLEWDETTKRSRLSDYNFDVDRIFAID